jgi:hypothetical protein
MGFFLAGLFFSSFVSAEPVRPACDQALQYLGAESLASRGEDTDFRFVTTLGHMHYLLDVYLPEVAKTAAKPSDGAVVEFKRMLEDWNDFRGNDKERERVLKTLKAQIDRGPFFHDPDYGSKLACVFKCDRPEKCEKKCKATGFKEISAILPVMRAAAACAVIEGESARFIASDFEAAFKRHQKQILERQKEVLSLSREMIALEDKVAKAYAPLIKQMSKHKVKATEPQETEFEKKMESYVALLDTSAGPGSGFLVKEKNETKLMTAYHVFGYDLELNWGPEKIEVFFRDDLKARKTNGKEIEMKSAAGRFSRMDDVLENDYPENRPGLKVVGKGRLPEKGQKFFALGFPATSEGRLRAIPCRFYGFTQSSQGQSARYTFMCDTGRDRFPGMSGGPIVDEEGVVWGVNTNVGEIASRILIASPIYSDENEVVHHGLPKYGLSELCLNRKNWAQYERCQLMENQYEKQIP